jgi:hypothetical protein
MSSPEPIGEATLEVLTDPSASEWLKSALQTAMTRDPVDALNDAFALAGLLEERLKNVLGLADD